MKKALVVEGTLYLGTAKEVSHAYRYMRDKEIAMPVFGSTPCFNYERHYGLLVNWDNEMYVVSSDMALAILFNLD